MPGRASRVDAGQLAHVARLLQHGSERQRHRPILLKWHHATTVDNTIAPWFTATLTGRSFTVDVPELYAPTDVAGTLAL